MYPNLDIPLMTASSADLQHQTCMRLDLCSVFLGLFASGGGKDIAVGVVICVVFPAVMFLFAAIFVARHIYRDNRRRAAYVLEGDPELQEKVICFHPQHISSLFDLLCSFQTAQNLKKLVQSNGSKFGFLTCTDSSDSLKATPSFPLSQRASLRAYTSCNHLNL